MTPEERRTLINDFCWMKRRVIIMSLNHDHSMSQPAPDQVAFSFNGRIDKHHPDGNSWSVVGDDFTVAFSLNHVVRVELRPVQLPIIYIAP